MEENFHRKEVEGIELYIRNEMMDKAYMIDWLGFWIFGGFVIKELQ